MIIKYKIKIKTSNFIKKKINYNIKSFKNIINTRFPPEASGDLHIGHVKSILLNIEISKIYNGLFLIRIDDTNPKKNKIKYKKIIVKSILWIKNFKNYFNKKIFFVSNYFYKLYQYLEVLIKKKYSFNKIKLKLKELRKLRLGFYKEKKILIKIKKKINNFKYINLYRVLYVYHYRTKYYWFIYPLYDYSNVLSDKLENIKYSLCTLEFISNKIFYNWIKKNIYKKINPIQVEFSKLNFKNNINSKRIILKLKKKKYIKNNKDKRLFTISSLKSRGINKKDFLLFYKKLSISKSIKNIESNLLFNNLNYKINKKSFIKNKVILIIKNFQKNRLEKFFIKNKSYFLSKFLILDETFFKNNKTKKFKIKKKKYSLKNTDYNIVFTNFLKKKFKTILFCNIFKKRKNYKEIYWLNQFYKNKILINVNKNLFRKNIFKKKNLKLIFNFKSKKKYIVYITENFNIKKKTNESYFNFINLGIFYKNNKKNKFIKNKFYYISK